MKKSKSNVAVCLSVAALIGALLTPTLSFAQFKSQNMPVRAQVNVNCNFTSTPTMNFASYDPADLNATAALAGSIGVNVRCTQGAVVTIGIGDGLHAGTVVGSNRAMQLGVTTNRLGYDFYHEGTFTTLWTNSGGGLYSHTAVNNQPATVMIYGRVPGGQDVPAGTYDDTVVVTVTY
jgi:spore coat protein U-like protein